MQLGAGVEGHAGRGMRGMCTGRARGMRAGRRCVDPRLTFFFAGVLAYTLGLEVVIVSLATTIDEELARAIFFIIPPTTKVSHAVAGVFWQAADICRGTPEVRTQECATRNKTMPILPESHHK